jgi:hypothetical protein
MARASVGSSLSSVSEGLTRSEWQVISICGGRRIGLFLLIIVRDSDKLNASIPVDLP